MRRQAVHVMAMFCVVTLWAGTSAIAQSNSEGSPAPKSKPRVQKTVQGERLRPLEQRVQEALGATQEQWRSIRPRVMKIYALDQQLAVHRMPSVRGERQGRPATPARQLTPLGKATAALQESLANPAASPETIRAQVAAVRQERENIRKELQVARAGLRQVLTDRQQDQALLLGLLE